ncbi:DUF397 domain-containing protein [Kineosporia sp. J2-2]|uniref:DUF397 domain-containing protein n=1 Tax=Kineosporia corallincola TaxID=2835133 RepID=A0ABS5TFY0_9ACTN|nr:DUF397 domain-containing protein [Kineosporia corallincola]MBT0770002.1 DUF397 domain-containing protein [Kineosporia corallincola]
MTADISWFKASASDTGGACVEMRRHHGTPELRDSKNPTGAVLQLSPAGLTTWLTGARDGEFDHLSHPA